jgi:hypothetical protein
MDLFFTSTTFTSITFIFFIFFFKKNKIYLSSNNNYLVYAFLYTFSSVNFFLFKNIIVSFSFIVYFLFFLKNKSGFNHIFFFNLIINLLNSVDIFNFFVLIEFINFLIFTFIVFFRKNKAYALSKTTYSFISVNLINFFSLTLFLFFFYYKNKSFFINQITYTNLFENLLPLKIFFNVFFFLKLGILTGPLFNLNFYLFLKKDQIAFYSILYFFIIPISLLHLFEGFFFLKKIHHFLIIIVLASNIVFIKKKYNFRVLSFLSSQTNIFYILIFLNLIKCLTYWSLKPFHSYNYLI